MIDKITIRKNQDAFQIKIDEQIKVLIQTARNKVKAQEAIEKLIDYQKQKDVIPSLTVLDYGDSIDQIYENGATVTIGTDFFHIHTSGYEVIIKAVNSACANIYNWYARLFELHNQTEKTDDEKDEYDSLMLYCTMTFQFPVMWFGDPDTLQKKFIEQFEEYVKLLEYSNSLLQDEDLKGNEEFKEKIDFEKIMKG